MSGESASGRPGSDSSGSGPRGERTSALEWAVAALGLLLVVGAIAFLATDAVRRRDAPPDVVVRADSVTPLGAGGYLVRFSAVNRGYEAAADVNVVGELRDAEDVETRRATLDYLPGHSTRRGGLFFTGDPRRAALRLWAEGYREP